MALTWDDKSRKDHSGRVASESYRAQVPHWGEASVHPTSTIPGRCSWTARALFLDNLRRNTQ